MSNSLLFYFTDPFTRASTIACMLMCLAISLIGVLIFIQRRSLLTEVLSHAAYPGIILGAVVVGGLLGEDSSWIFIPILISAFIFSVLALWLVELMVQKLKVPSDASFCFVLSFFFGMGLLIASRVQLVFSSWYRLSQIFLYGQAATITDGYIMAYGALALFIIIFIVMLYRHLEALYFNRDYAQSIGMRVNLIEHIIFVLLAFAVVIGLRSVGIVLMSGMLIAPAVAARQYTDRLSIMLLLAGVFASLSGLLGNVISLELSLKLEEVFSGEKISFPIGPMIVLSAIGLAMVSILLAPKRGIIFRYARVLKFKICCWQENILKALLKEGEKHTFFALREKGQITFFFLLFLLFKMVASGWIKRENGGFVLTNDGRRKAMQIMRLHQLWEVYLVDYMEMRKDKVHTSAEEMEHIITPQLEKKLNVLLSYPQKDPYKQPISQKEEYIL